MTGQIAKVFLCISVILRGAGYVSGHGYLLDPPARTSLWREGHNAITNVDDNNMACGGKEIQWGLNGGKCGFCGDRYDGPRHSEAGGKFATGIISRRYKKGQVLPITVVLTAPHGGWFEFRICPNNNISKPVTQDCLDMHLLKLVKDPSTTRFSSVTTGGAWKGTVYELDYLLPDDLTCEQCVLQWLYNTGKDWGCEAKSDVCAVGLGPQEQFYGCADIAITDDGSTATKATTKKTKSTTPRTSTKTTTKQPKSTTARMTTAPTTKKVPITTTIKKTRTTTSVPGRRTTPLKSKTTRPSDNTLKEPCVAKGIFRGSIMDNRCRYLCRMGTCPQLMCADSCRKLSQS